MKRVCREITEDVVRKLDSANCLSLYMMMMVMNSIYCVLCLHIFTCQHSTSYTHVTIFSGVQLLQNLQLLVCLVLTLYFMHEGVSDVLVGLLAYCVQLPTQHTYPPTYIRACVIISLVII